MKANMNRKSKSHPKSIKQREEEKTIETKKSESIGSSNNRMKSSKLVSENLFDRSNKKIRSKKRNVWKSKWKLLDQRRNEWQKGLHKKQKSIERITLLTSADEIQRNIVLFSLHKLMLVRSFKEFIEKSNGNSELRKSELGKPKGRIWSSNMLELSFESILVSSLLSEDFIGSIMRTSKRTILSKWS